jgi:hypothetical protein
MQSDVKRAPIACEIGFVAFLFIILKKLKSAVLIKQNVAIP